MNNIHKDEKRLKAWIKRLTPQQKIFITELVKIETAEATQKILSVVEMCIFATLRETFPELHTNEIINFIEKYIDEVSNNKNYIMASEEMLKMIKEEEKKAEIRVLELLNSNFDQKKIVDTIKKEYKNLNATDVKNIYKRVKDKWVMPTVPVKERVRDNSLPVIKTKLDSEDKELLKKEELIPMKDLEILKPIHLKYKGQEIIIGSDFIECGEGKFDSLEDLELYRKEEIKLFNQRIDTITNVVKKFVV